jgi:hypothetical protein
MSDSIRPDWRDVKMLSEWKGKEAIDGPQLGITKAPTLGCCASIARTEYLISTGKESALQWNGGTVKPILFKSRRSWNLDGAIAGGTTEDSTEDRTEYV